MTDAMKPTRRPRRPSAAAPTTPDPVEIAMEAEASGTAPTGEASALLRRHSALIGKQLVLASNEIFRNRIRSIRDIAIAAMVVALLLAAGAVVWSASRASGLVIQPFTVPPELVEDGLDGRAVAALFQDELIRLEAATVSARPATSFRNDWSEGITVEVEAGGLSLTDTYRALVRWLGQETYIGGGLTRTSSGLELVVRSSDGTAVTVQGPADRPADLMREAAELTYEQTQPYRFWAYLGDAAEALPEGPERRALIDRRQAILVALLASPLAEERIWAHNGLSTLTSLSTPEAVTVLLAALEIDPEHPILLANAMEQTRYIGRAEASLALVQRVDVSLAAGANRAKVSQHRQRLFPLISAAYGAEFRGDWQLAVDLHARVTEEAGGWAGRAAEFRDNQALALIALHEPSTLVRRQIIERLALGGAPAAISAIELRLQGYADSSLDRWPSAVDSFEAALTTPTPEMERDLRSRAGPAADGWPRQAPD
ncbi:MAG: hypothetical protein ACK45V_01610, partial [Brevundimonas sp.]